MNAQQKRQHVKTIRAQQKERARIKRMYARLPGTTEAQPIHKLEMSSAYGKLAMPQPKRKTVTMQTLIVWFLIPMILAFGIVLGVISGIFQI